MILISRYETTYLPPEDDEEDYCPDGDGRELVADEPVSFRDLVSLMRAHPHASCHPARGETFEWLCTDSELDYMTGELAERTLHYSHKNEPRAAKYWRCAMKAAGIIR